MALVLCTAAMHLASTPPPGPQDMQQDASDNQSFCQSVRGRQVKIKCITRYGIMINTVRNQCPITWATSRPGTFHCATCPRLSVPVHWYVWIARDIHISEVEAETDKFAAVYATQNCTETGKWKKLLQTRRNIDAQYVAVPELKTPFESMYSPHSIVSLDLATTRCGQWMIWCIPSHQRSHISMVYGEWLSRHLDYYVILTATWLRVKWLCSNYADGRVGEM
jgi:hypothetical protein